MRTLLIAGILLLGAAVDRSFAEVLNLKNGRRVEGKIIEETASTIKIDFVGVGVTFERDEIESIEKEIPDIIVKDEEQKQKVIQELVDEKAVDRIYTVDKTNPLQEKARESLRQQQERAAAYEEEGEPRPNIGVQFKSIEEIAAEEEARINSMPPEERRRYEENKAAAERFYDER